MYLPASSWLQVKLLLSLGAKLNVAAAKGKTNDLTVASSPGGVKFTTRQQIGDRTALHFAAEKGAGDVLQVWGGMGWDGGGGGLWDGMGWGGVGLRWQNMQVFTKPMVTQLLARLPARFCWLLVPRSTNRQSVG